MLWNIQFFLPIQKVRIARSEAELSIGISFSAILAMEHKCVSSVEGIIDDNVDRSIRNLTKIGSQGMNETDKLVLEIMTHKQCD